MGIEDPVSVSVSELGTKEAIEKKEKKESIDMLEWVIVWVSWLVFFWLGVCWMECLLILSLLSVLRHFFQHKLSRTNNNNLRYD